MSSHPPFPASPLNNCHCHWSAILERVHDAVVIRNIQNQITFWNRGAELLLGYRASEIMGQSASLLVPSNGAEQELQWWTRLQKEGQICQYRAQRLHREGFLLEVAITLLPVRDETGQICGFSEILHNKTSRRQKLEDRMLLAAIVDSSHDAIISKDLSGIITSWNAGAESLFKYTAQEAIGQSIMMLIPPSHLKEEDKILECLRRGERIDQFETVRVTKEGRLLNISLTVSPVKDKRGKVIGASKIARNITEQKQMASALQAAQVELQSYVQNLENQVQERTANLQQAITELESFAYSISHDLRAPLRSMQSFAHFLKEDFEGQLGPQGKDYLDRIIRAATRMDSLIRSVLTFSRVGRADLSLEKVDLEDVLRGILQTYPQFHPPAAEVAIHGPLPCVLGNEASLTQCFTNLISNAVKFVHAGVLPSVKIWAECGRQTVRVWIEDNGIGIAREYQERIFGIFERLNTQYEGTGMGLAIVQKAAQRMSGKVGVESELGKGSRFWLELALAPPEEGGS